MSEAGGEETHPNFEVVGEGPVVVLLHGWGGCIASMSPIREMLRFDHTVVSVDLPGFGESPMPADVWGSEDYARCVGELLARVGVSRVMAVMGHSFGGKVALRMVQYPLVAVESLILVGTPAVRLPPSGKTKRRIALVKRLKHVSRWLPGAAQTAVIKWTSRFGSEDYRNAGEMRDILVRAVNEDLRGMLASVHVPTLLLWGKNDPAAPLEIGRIMESSIAGSGLVVFAESGHFPYLDEPQAFAAVTRSFLGSMAGRGEE